MSTELLDQHRSSLEKLLAVEIESQRKILALSNQRIQAIKKLLVGVEDLYQDVEGSGTPTVSAKSSKGENKPKNRKLSPSIKPVRVPKGQIPRLIDALQMVIQNKKLKAEEVHSYLKTKGWLPKSKDPLGYIRYTLSEKHDIFLRVEGERGLYYLDPSNPYHNSRSKHKAPKKIEEPLKSSSKSNPKVMVASSPPVSESELSPLTITTAETYKIVQSMLDGTIPTD
jgi:hypothetical protein